MTAQSPTDMPRAQWAKVAKRTGAEIGRDRVSLIAAGIAFYGLLALFPGIAACMAIAGLVVQPDQVVSQLEQLSGMLPAEAADIIIGQAQDVAGSRQGGLGLAAVGGLLIAIYSASKGVASLIDGVNVAYGENETRGFIWLKTLTLLLTLFVIIGLLIGIAASVVVPAVLSALQLGPGFEWIVRIVTYAVLLILAVFGLAVIYRYGPDRARPRWRWVTPGAIVAAVGWFAGTVLFAWYVASFGSYNETFGALAGVVVLLMWMWVSAFIVLLGAEIDAELERQAKREA